MRKESDKKYRVAAKLLSRNIEAEQEHSALDLHPKEFAQMQKVWELTGKIDSPAPPQDAWQRLRAKLQGTPSQGASILPLRPKAAPTGSRFGGHIVRIAAAIVFILLSYWSAQKFIFSDMTVATQNGERKTIELADGSVVELNAASKISYPKNFARDSREVTLDGEAFFQVAPDAIPFIVKTHQAHVQVLGTAFNVRARKNSTAAVVAEGKVVFANRQNQQVVLQKGEISEVVADNAPTPARAANLDKYLAWREGRLEFERTPIKEVFAELQRQFDVQIEYNDLNLAGRTLTASFYTRQRIEDVLSAICLTFDWEFRKINGVYDVE